MSTATEDRRRMIRRPVQLLATCHWRTRKGRVETSAWVKDVHENGLRLESPGMEEEDPQIQKGLQMDIRGFFYDEKGEHPVEAKVRWVQKSDSGWAAGVEFVNGRRPASFKDFLRVVRDGS
jgi:hypothetical protein